MPRRKKEIQAIITRAINEKPLLLDLTNCPLTEFIDQVCQLTQLTELNLTHCHLNRLPDQFGNLIELQKLSLRENSIETLPESIIQLTKLIELDLTLSGLRTVPKVVEEWLKKIPKCNLSHTDLEKQFEKPVFVKPSYPNGILHRLQHALDRYGSANSCEDHHGDGTAMREQSDQEINDLFENIPELKEWLSEFYQDFQQKSFYSYSPPSEQVLKQNPFKLPTNEDKKWASEHYNISNSEYRLSEKTSDRQQPLHFINGDKKKLIAMLSYGDETISNQPYAADEHYFADYAAKLYRAGQQLFYLELIEFGFGERTSWFVSQNNGEHWQKLPYFLYEYLEQENTYWLLVDSIK